MIHTLCILSPRVWHRPAELLLERRSYILLIQILIVSQSSVFVLWLKAGQQLDPLPQISLHWVKQMNKWLWSPTRQHERWHLPGKGASCAMLKPSCLPLPGSGHWPMGCPCLCLISGAADAHLVNGLLKKCLEHLVLSLPAAGPLSVSHVMSGIASKHLLSNCNTSGLSDLIVSSIWKCFHREFSCHIKVEVRYQWFLHSHRVSCTCTLQ